MTSWEGSGSDSPADLGGARVKAAWHSPCLRGAHRPSPRFARSMTIALPLRLRPSLSQRRIAAGFLALPTFGAACSVPLDLLPQPGIGLPPVSTGGQSGVGGTAIGEGEREANFRAPVVSGSWLWTSNPATDRVAAIHAGTLDIDVEAGGDGPTFLAPLPTQDGATGALVLNVLGADASVLRRNAAGVVTIETVPVARGASAWEVGRKGRSAIAWARSEDGLLGPLDGYQEVTVLDLKRSPIGALAATVGFRPTQVAINESETRAFVVSSPGVTVFDLESDPPAILREIVLPAPDPGEKRDISFTPDGKLALLRETSAGAILLVKTETDERVRVPLGRPVTDLDLSADGSFALAVVRGTGGPSVEQGGAGAPGGVGGVLFGGAAGEGEPAASEDELSWIVRFAVPAIFDAPGAYDVYKSDSVIGSAVIAESGTHAVGYTSVLDSSALVALDLGSGELRSIDVAAPIQAAFISSDGKNALTVMTSPSGSAQAGAFALVPLDAALPPRIEGTSSVVRFATLFNDRAFLTTWGSATASAQSFVGAFPELHVDSYPLPSAPLASGIVAELRTGFVAGEHPEGRVTFLHLDTLQAQTVTGFELASSVESK